MDPSAVTLVLVGTVPSEMTKALFSEQGVNANHAARAMATAITKEFEKVHSASSEAHTEPTPAQANAGNYKMGHLMLHGLDITIETPAGASRAPKVVGGKQHPPLKHPYGYIRSIQDPRNPEKRVRTVGRDSDHVDVIIGPHPSSELVHVVNQINAHKDGSFDEHKCVLGARNAKEAHQIYHDNYSSGWKGYGGMKQLTMDQFKAWLAKGKRSRPI